MSVFKLTRREFIKSNAVAAAAATAGIAAPGTVMAQAKGGDGIRWDKGACRYCGTGCGVLVGTKDGRIVATQGDPDAPVNKGLNCVKGYFLAKIQYGKDRLTQPMLRMKDGKFDKNGEFTPISWDKAFDIMAEKVKTIEEMWPIWNESQFVHAQRYVTDRGSDVSEQELLNQKANFEAKAADAKAMQTRDGNLVEEARGRQTSLIQFRDALHETAARILTEFRAVSRSLEEIGEAMAATSTRFENTDLYQLAETIRNRLDKADGDPFVMSDIRKIGSLAVGLGLAAQSKDIARVKKESNQLATRYREQKTALCSNVISGTQKGLSPFNAEWLQGQDRFDAPAEMKSQIESSIEEKRWRCR